VSAEAPAEKPPGVVWSRVVVEAAPRSRMTEPSDHGAKPLGDVGRLAEEFLAGPCRELIPLALGGKRQEEQCLAPGVGSVLDGVQWAGVVLKAHQEAAHGRERVVLTDRSGAIAHICELPRDAPSSDTQLNARVPGDILGADTTGRYFDLSVQRGEVRQENPDNIAIQIHI
jgi:hypothetical protein